MFSTSVLKDAINNPLVKMINLSHFTKENVRELFQDFDFSVSQGNNEHDFRNRFVWIFSFLTSDKDELIEEMLNLIEKNYSKKKHTMETQIQKISSNTRFEDEHKKLEALNREKDGLNYSLRDVSDYILKMVVLNENYQKLVPMIKNKGFWFDKLVFDGQTLEMVFQKPDYEEKMFFLIKNLDQSFGFNQYISISSTYAFGYDSKASEKERNFFDKFALFLNSNNFNFEKLKTMTFENFKDHIEKMESNFIDSLAKMNFLNFKSTIINSIYPTVLNSSANIQAIITKINQFVEDEKNHHHLSIESSSKGNYSKNVEIMSNMEFLFENPRYFLHTFIKGNKINELIDNKTIIPFPPKRNLNDDGTILEHYILPLIRQGEYPLKEAFNYLLNFKNNENKFSKESKIVSKLKTLIEASGIHEEAKYIKLILEEGLEKFPEQIEKMEINYSLNKQLVKPKNKFKML